MQFDIKTNILTQLLIVYGYVVSDILKGFCWFTLGMFRCFVKEREGNNRGLNGL
jgi:hypothetical protein